VGITSQSKTINFRSTYRIAAKYGVTIEDPAVKPEFYSSKGEGWSMDEYNQMWDKFRFQSVAI